MPLAPRPISTSVLVPLFCCQRPPPAVLDRRIRDTHLQPSRGGYLPASNSIKGGDPAAGSPTATLLRLHPSHQPYLRPLPPPFRGVGSGTSGRASFRGVTGGEYKARERIHGRVADRPLLAIPASCRRVAACNPNWDRVSEIRSTSRLRYSLCPGHCSTCVAQGVRGILT